jgi:hypothetical protein
MRDLTLDQVQEAGRFAFNEVRGHGGYRADWTRRENGELEVEVIGNNASVNGMPRVPIGGWHHIPGCDCKYCK